MDADKKLLETSINNVMQPTNADGANKIASSSSYEIKGYDLNKGLDYNKILESYKTIGFQATNLGNAINEVNRMVNTDRYN